MTAKSIPAWKHNALRAAAIVGMTLEPPITNPGFSTAFLAACVSSDGNGHDFGLTEDVVATMRDAGWSAQVAGAALTYLQQRGDVIAYIDEGVTTDSGTWHQFTLRTELVTKLLDPANPTHTPTEG